MALNHLNKQPINQRIYSHHLFFGMPENHSPVIELTLVGGLARSEKISLKAFYA